MSALLWNLEVLAAGLWLVRGGAALTPVALVGCLIGPFLTLFALWRTGRLRP